MSEVWANFVVGADGATTHQGNSRALSSHLDRRRFHSIRESFDQILIGGQTARSEPYGKTPKPLVVVTRQPTNIGSAARNPLVKISALSPTETLSQLTSDSDEKILVEGGASFLRELIAADLVDGLFITQTNLDGDGEAIDLESLTQNFEISQIEDSDGESFYTYIRRR